jgi:acyl transferase domain-containing protein
MSPSTEQIANALRVSAKETERLRHLNRRLREVSNEPIAIVGMSCRYPGEVTSPAELWSLVAGGTDAISEFPRDRGWEVERIYDPEPGKPGKSYVREGGFLADAGEFDAAFFGIGPREALSTDPQGRLLLEASWEALEDAGLPPDSLRGSQAGVFAGVMCHDYGWGHRPTADQLGFFGTGSDGSVASGRVAYVLGLEGPAITIDTACSSSLVSIHLAAQALRRGECSLALAGGATVLSTPSIFILFCHQRGVAMDGRCKPFAEAADGVGVSEGVGMLVLERLSDARREGHRILATIRGSAINQDGASNGLTAPNGPSQERVIRQALANAGLEPADVDAVEAHGTGTALGDPIEAGALLATYGRERQQPLYLGSVKSNIGHPQAAAGVAGVIKTVMAMRERTLPKTLHLDSPSSRIEWSAGKIELLEEAEPWLPGRHPRRAAVSSFGISGTNAHLILEEPPEPSPLEAREPEAPPAEPVLRGPVPISLSAKSQPALAAHAERICRRLERDPSLEPADLAYSLATTRSAFEHRVAIVADSREQALDGLGAVAEGRHEARLSAGVSRSQGAPVLLFSGHGAQWPGMALELIEDSPVFARHMESCEEALSPFLDWSPRSVLQEPDEGWLDRPDVVQPILFATMVSLARLWQACGVRPAAVVGHSQGEIAAAHFAGGLSLADAAQVAAVRSQIMVKLAGQGGLASVGLSAVEIEKRIAGWEGRLEVAAVNGPRATIVAGDREALDELLEGCREEEVRARPILGGVVASHSAYVEELRDEVIEALATTAPRSGEIPFYSTVTGGALDTRHLDAAYWYRNLRQTVLFEPVVRELLGQGQGLLIEVSSHPVLTPAVQESADAAADPAEVTVLGTLRRGEGGAERFVQSLAEAHVAGAALDWEALLAGSAPSVVSLPTYPFQRRRYWLTAAAGEADPSAIGQSDPDHPLLGAALEDPLGGGLVLTGRLSLQTHPWLADHAAFGIVLAPGTALVEMALAAGAEAGCGLLEELALEAPLILPEQGGVAVQVVLGEPEQEDGRCQVSIYSRPDGEDEVEWTRHASGVLGAESAGAEEALGSWPPEGAEPLDVELLYERFEQRDLSYGHAFQGVRAAWRRGEEIFAELSLPESQAGEAGRFRLHPALLDAAGHPGLDLAIEAGEQGELQLPFAWRGIHVGAPGAAAVRARISPAGGGHGVALFDLAGQPVAGIDSIVLRPIDRRRLQAATRGRNSLLGLSWEAPAGIDPGPAPTELAQLGGAPIPGLGAEVHADLTALLGSLEAGAPVPEAVVVDARARRDGDDAARACRLALEEALSLLQAWLLEERLAEARLVLLTEGAVATDAGEAPRLASAPLWGLLRSAGTEHPGRFAAIDVDGEEASLRELAMAVGAGAEEPQLAIRAGGLLVPRLAPVAAADIPALAPTDAESTVLITGGTSGLGALVARHLAAEHGARNLLLVSRSGPQAAGAGDLRAELESLGCAVEIVACDVGDREQLRELIESVPPARPLGTVVHSAGALDDRLLGAISPDQVERVFGPKADAAWHLHELTADAGLSQFLMFSSVAGLLGGAAQATYSAANAFLDALAAHRQAMGLPGTAMAWGSWAQRSRLAGEIGDAELDRALRQIRERLGAVPMESEQGLELFDAARAIGEPLTVPAIFDPGVLRAQAGAGTLPSVLRGLVRAPERRPREDGSLARQLAATPEDKREALVLDLVRAHAAAVLGCSSGEEVDPDRAFKDLGFDSLGAVELRNRLAAATGMRLHSTLVFDHPTPASLAAFLRAEAGGQREAAVAPRRRIERQEPVAIVGMACRYPGAADSPEELWNLVAGGADVISELPQNRGWDFDRLYDPEPGRAGTFYVREGGFLIDAADFDPGFFGISPREALSMDPQQRALLEVSWQALEDAGVDPASLRGSETGVFAGVMYQDYGPTAGLGSSSASGRLAYTFGLEGPAISVDTACSSSLVAMHLAARSLHAGECSLALAGGVAISATPAMLTLFSQQRALSADGRCKAFADGADGTGVSEGVGVVLLERLSDAQRNGHRVLATIRGSAINQDGASNGLTAPSGPSQERVIAQALAEAGLEPGEVDAVEAHGTGTALGDPIEAGALLAAYGQGRERPLWLGSIKSNIGHAQAAAGSAGVIKAVMAMREEVLPKTLHAGAPSTKIEWGEGDVELLQEARPWKADGRPRRVGVSSFGASGTNAHLILEEPEPPTGAQAEESPPTASTPVGSGGVAGPLLLPMSAKTAAAVGETASRLRLRLSEDEELDPVDFAFSLAGTRAAFEHRAVAVGDDRGELLEALAAIEGGSPSALEVRGRASRNAKLAYLFSGQGSQRPGMGSELYGVYPAFAEALDRVCDRLDPQLGLSLRDLVFDRAEGAAARLDDTTYAQPALFALEVALFHLLESLGLRPDLLVGHSIGELSAAHVAGVFGLEDAARLVAARGRLMGELPGGGAMLAVQASEEEVAEAIAAEESRLAIAALNGPRALVVSGEGEAISRLAERWSAEGRKTKRLAVSHAFHSPLIEPMLSEFARVAAEVDYAEPRIPLVSNLTGELLDPAQATDPAYWVAHARQPVRFSAAVATLRAQGANSFLELGPGAVLSAMAVECAEAEASPRGQLTVAPCMRGEQPEPRSLALALAGAYAGGVGLDWERYFAGAAVERVSLPAYPFERRRYWLAPSAGGTAGRDPDAHPFLGPAVALAASEEVLLSGRVSLRTHPWLADHALAGVVVVPGTLLLELALHAGRETGAEGVEELVLQAPLSLPERGAVQLQVSVAAPDEEGRRELAIYSCEEADEGSGGEWRCHARGMLASVARPEPRSMSSWPPGEAQPLEVDDLYGRLADHGIDYGPAFRTVRRAWQRGEELFVEVSLEEEQVEGAGRFLLHPALLDAAGHVGADLALGSGEGEPRLPFAWRGVRVDVAGASGLRLCISADPGGGPVAVHDQAGGPIATVESVSLRPLDSGGLAAVSVARLPLHRVEWAESAASLNGSEPPGVAVLGDLPGGEIAAERYEDWAALLAALERGAPPPGVILTSVECDGPAGDAAAGAHAAARDLLALAQTFLAEPRLAASRLCLLSAGAVAASPGEAADPVGATAWGMLRSAQSEHPGRFALIDSDGSPASLEALGAALRRTALEPQLALREGRAQAPRLLRAGAPGAVGRAFDPEKTVLISGGTGGLGALLARHLVVEHGARRLLLASRQGDAAKGALELRRELEELGAEVSLESCDAADRDQVRTLLEAVPAGAPLGAVVHTAGVVEDGLLQSLDPECLDRVLAPKVDGAWHLHELTAGLDLSHFLLFSSAAGLLGPPGQANYAAANAFLDALASRRQADGLAASSVAWGPWAEETGIGAAMSEAQVERLRRLGLVPLPPQQGLALFDACWASPEPLLAAVAFERGGLRAQASAGALSPILAHLAGPTAREPESESLVERLRGAPEEERENLVLELVRGHVAAVLGHASAAEIEAEAAFMDLGFDSLAAVELRNRLNSATGLRTQPTLVFDHPSARAVAQHLLEQVAPGLDREPGDGLGRAPAVEALAALGSALSEVKADEVLRDEIGAGLRALLTELTAPAEPDLAGEQLAELSDEEMFELIDEEFGAR